MSLPEIAGTRSGPLLIIGCGRNVWADLKKIKDEAWPGDRMVLNRAGLYYDRPIHHWVSLHPRKHRRWTRPFKDAPVRHTDVEGMGYDAVWSVGYLGGSVALFAAVIGLRMGYGEIVLAGCPLDGAGHFYDPPWVRSPWFEKQATRDAWAKQLPFFKGRVRSLSGNTKRWLECR